jgi:hypothetical protein
MLNPCAFVDDEAATNATLEPESIICAKGSRSSLP